MKFIAYILSFFVLILTVTPCVDTAKDNHLLKTELSQTANDNHQDHCTPFCVCSCCGSPVLYQGIIIDFKNSALSTEYNSEYHTAYISMLFSSIWQPPKLS